MNFWIKYWVLTAIFSDTRAVSVGLNGLPWRQPLTQLSTITTNKIFVSEQNRWDGNSTKSQSMKGCHSRSTTNLSPSKIANAVISSPRTTFTKSFVAQGNFPAFGRWVDVKSVCRWITLFGKACRIPLALTSPRFALCCSPLSFWLSSQLLNVFASSVWIRLRILLFL